MTARRIVLVQGSPHADGSIGKLLDALADGARRGGAETETIDCYALQARPCVACGPNATSGYCIFHDGMDRVYAALEGAHAVVAGSPVYFDTVSAPFKLLIDRCNCVTPLVTVPGGGLDCVAKWPRTRRGVFVAACSSNHTHELAERTVRGWMKWVGARWQETIVWRHADDDRGSVPADLVEYARGVGRALAASEPLRPEPPAPAKGA